MLVAPFPFEFNRGGRQGGPETPDMFNCIIEDILDGLVTTWQSRGWGAALDSHVVSHIVWADIVWVFSQCPKQLQSMLEELAQVVYAAGFCWKASSLEVLKGRVADDFVPKVSINGSTLEYKAADSMLALGSLLDQDGRTTATVDARLEVAEGVYWKHAKTLKGRGDLTTRLRAWSSAPGSSAVFGSSAWHVSRHVLHTVRRWEYRLLRKMLALHFKPGEGPSEYNQRTTRRLEAWFAKTGVWFLHHRVLSSVYKGA